MHIAIYGASVVRVLSDHTFNHGVVGQEIIGVQDAYNVARCHLHAFVHRVVDSTVFL